MTSNYDGDRILTPFLENQKMIYQIAKRISQIIEAFVNVVRSRFCLIITGHDRKSIKLTDIQFELQTSSKDRFLITVSLNLTFPLAFPPSPQKPNS